jgi:hypothetical protein
VDAGRSGKVVAMNAFLRWLAALFTRNSAPASDVAVPAPLPTVRALLSLTEADYVAAAERLGCSVAAIKAVAEVESTGRGFLSDGRPTILFEAHVFDRLTGGKFRGALDRFGVLLSVPSWRRDLYGAAGAHQYLRLEDAMKLDERAAVFATSWGTFQIMGFNFASLGFPDVDTFQEAVAAKDEAREHLDMFVRFILVNGLDDELRNLSWAAFARGYNGPGYAANRYDVKMAEAYTRYVGST